jgi:hypothetical protein
VTAGSKEGLGHLERKEVTLKHYARQDQTRLLININAWHDKIWLDSRSNNY